MNPLERLARKKRGAIALWYERIMVAIATVNLALVAFDLSYIQLRNFWLQGTVQVPFVGFIIKVPLLSDSIDSSPITTWYDPIKGIQGNRDTENYLRVVRELEKQAQKTGYSSPLSKQLLAQLRELSEEMINQNPFQGAGKSGTLEKIKNRMRDHMEDDSAKDAFNQFWTAENLLFSSEDQGELFNTTIAPLMASNYYRSIDETGGYTNLFAALDFPFALLFLVEFLARSLYISQKHDTITLTDAMLWRWYDIFLFLPLFRWLRIIPVTIRLHQAKLINLEPIRIQLSRGFVATIAGELTEVIIIRVINQLENEIRSGSLARQLFEGANREYIDLNNINEIEAITHRLTEVVICQVLPTLQPQIQEIINHNIEQVAEATPFYQNIKNIPPLAQLPSQFSQQVSEQLSHLIAEGSQNLYEAIKNDTVGAELMSQLAESFGKSLSAELQQKHTTQELESLVTAFLEEFKINYVQRLAEEDIEKILEETKRLEKSKKR
ncbi:MULTISPECIES: hypothetical protein [unclassified Roseofilum]|uniref:hypothetical protein n=1 Tax=unclassified Roseofilum TaxID=2620099 RepID=UPI000E9E3599|nr:MULTISPECIES: hypothetical protein [unclassified Roseofilum]MBP0010419.1 hypothetical protein [Roseofilum sp. Belize Diploria]MBP0034745.1 hypothetical protein [Roseofilum sp. Belize BBD 4]HBQ99247.1 hypothetical protein [Cyanobacteria bacterium UBA11691]